MGEHASALAWELLTKLTYLTGRIYVPNPETAHELLLAWLAESDDHIDTAHEWLSIAHTRLTGTSLKREHPMNEFLLRTPIEDALGVRRQGQGGIVGVIRSHTSRPIRTWLKRRRFQ